MMKNFRSINRFFNSKKKFKSSFNFFIFHKLLTMSKTEPLRIDDLNSQSNQNQDLIENKTKYSSNLSDIYEIPKNLNLSTTTVSQLISIVTPKYSETNIQQKLDNETIESNQKEDDELRKMIISLETVNNQLKAEAQVQREKIQFLEQQMFLFYEKWTQIESKIGK